MRVFLSLNAPKKEVLLLMYLFRAKGKLDFSNVVVLSLSLGYTWLYSRHTHGFNVRRHVPMLPPLRAECLRPRPPRRSSQFSHEIQRPRASR